MPIELPHRRDFLGTTASVGATLSLAGLATAAPVSGTPKKIRVGIIGCGSVSHRYLPHLAECPYAELVSTCDIIPERAIDQAKATRFPTTTRTSPKCWPGRHSICWST